MVEIQSPLRRLAGWEGVRKEYDFLTRLLSGHLVCPFAVQSSILGEHVSCNMEHRGMRAQKGEYECSSLATVLSTSVTRLTCNSGCASAAMLMNNTFSTATHSPASSRVRSGKRSSTT